MKQTTILLEAESFSSPGGWVVDQQFMDIMGSPYLLAHGLGTPVEDASTLCNIPQAGTYRLWARTMDWVARWDAPGTPGRFKVGLDGVPQATEFGTEGADWHWQKGDLVELTEGTHRISLKDQTGFEGRCDALLLTTDLDWEPPHGGEVLKALRKELLGLPATPPTALYDLVVVGGGIAGMSAALGAARLGLKTALVQDRPVLGGNNSSEVRVWLGGDMNKAPWPAIGDLTREFAQEHRYHYGELNQHDVYEDEKKLSLLQSEENLTLYLEHRLVSARKEGNSISEALIVSTRTSKEIALVAPFFADCTGDGCLGLAAGADHVVQEQEHMGPSNLWYTTDTGQSTTFPSCPWALDLHDKPFPGRFDHNAQWGGKDPVNRLGVWFWESGFDWNPVTRAEDMRDWNFRAMYGAWDTLKNTDSMYPTRKLAWAAYVAGKRESVQLMGDVILTEGDVSSNREFEDGCVPCTWGLDVHEPHRDYVKGFEGKAFISYAAFGEKPDTYWLPYRCLYSRNIDNLFMAGRDISVSHIALGTVRVMNTGGMMGEIVAMAASICKDKSCGPRAVYEKHLGDLHGLMKSGLGCSEPSQKSKVKTG